MTVSDILLGVLGGVLSCLTSETFLRLPLALAVAGGAGRANMIATALGLGLSLVVTGLLAGSLGHGFGFEATLFRRIVCAVLVLQGIVLISVTLVEHYPMFAGGRGSVFHRSGASLVGGALRRLLLALFIGANWIPIPGAQAGHDVLTSPYIRRYARRYRQRGGLARFRRALASLRHETDCSRHDPRRPDGRVPLRRPSDRGSGG